MEMSMGKKDRGEAVWMRWRCMCACLSMRLINLNERFSHLINWRTCTRFVSIQLGLKAVLCGATTTK